MSQSRFSIVLVGVSALLRRPLVSRLRPAGFTARGSVGFRRSALPSVSELPSAGWPSGSLLPLFGMQRFGDCPRRAGSSAFRFGDCPRRVGLRTHCFRFSARTASEWLLGELVLPPSASEITAGRVGLRAHGFRFSACAASEIAVRRVGLRVHGFRFSACADPHRLTAEARTDGAQRHDTCFTSKHLSQHVNLPHRTP